MAPKQRVNRDKSKNKTGDVNKNIPHTTTESDINSRENSLNEQGIISKVPWKKVILRCFSSMLLVLMVYWTSNKDEQHNVFAKREESLQLKSQEVPCSNKNHEDKRFDGCISERCGRLVTDIIVSQQESNQLLQLCKKGISFGGSYGGASILDLHSGALSHNDAFINIYEKLKAEGKSNFFTSGDFKVYKNVRSKIQNVIAYNFGIQTNKLYLTHPTFFSKMTSKPPKTTHDEYWHVHIDKKTYPSFHYTSLLYLSDYGVDFTGGRFEFVDKARNVTIEPKMGRVSAFTSGAENPHYVERVKDGTRYALTVSFTCDPDYAISDPSIENFKK